MNVIILMSMLFLHIVDDYYLQGVLSKMKQREWWQQNAPDPLYKYDYIVALIEHAFSWTFMIMLPITVTMITNNEIITKKWVIIFVLNWAVHSIVDNLKANLHKCNLVLDQLVHAIQVIVTWAIFTYYI